MPFISHHLSIQAETSATASGAKKSKADDDVNVEAAARNNLVCDKAS